MSFPVAGTDIVQMKVVRALMLCSAVVGGMVTATEANLYLDLDYHTLQTARAAVQQALEHRQTGDRETWSVAGVGSGSVSPRRTWRSKSGHWCREFQETLRLANGRSSTAVGVRCRSDEGRWVQPSQ